MLGLQPGANLTEVRKAWRQLSATYNPEVAGNSKANLARIKKLNKAYDVLSNRTRRTKYDQAYQTKGVAAPQASAAPPAPRRARPSPAATQPAAHAPAVRAPAVPAPAAPAPTPAAPVKATPIPMPAPARIPVAPASSKPQREQAPAAPKPVAAPQAPRQSQPQEEPAAPSTPSRGLTRRTGLIAAAGVIGMAVLMAIGVAPALTRNNAPEVPAPAAFSPAAPAPLPGGEPEPAPILTPTETPAQVEPAPLPTVMLPAELTIAPAPAFRDSIPVMSLEAEALGYWGFQASGSPWQVDFSRQCQEAPCLRSGTLVTESVSSLWLRPRDLSASARTVSFDIKAASPACCASLKLIAGPIAGAAIPLPNDTAWTRFETALPGYLPVVLEWQFYWRTTGVSPGGGIWIDNIQFK